MGNTIAPTRKDHQICIQTDGHFTLNFTDRSRDACCDVFLMAYVHRGTIDFEIIYHFKSRRAQGPKDGLRIIYQRYSNSVLDTDLVPS